MIVHHPRRAPVPPGIVMHLHQHLHGHVGVRAFDVEYRPFPALDVHFEKVDLGVAKEGLDLFERHRIAAQTGHAFASFSGPESFSFRAPQAYVMKVLTVTIGHFSEASRFSGAIERMNLAFCLFQHILFKLPVVMGANGINNTIINLAEIIQSAHDLAGIVRTLAAHTLQIPARRHDIEGKESLVVVLRVELSVLHVSGQHL